LILPLVSFWFFFCPPCRRIPSKLFVPFNKVAPFFFFLYPSRLILSSETLSGSAMVDLSLFLLLFFRLPSSHIFPPFALLVGWTRFFLLSFSFFPHWNFKVELKPSPVLWRLPVFSFPTVSFFDFSVALVCRPLLSKKRFFLLGGLVLF